jgi:hypothetical protein
VFAISIDAASFGSPNNDVNAGFNPPGRHSSTSSPIFLKFSLKMEFQRLSLVNLASKRALKPPLKYYKSLGIRRTANYAYSHHADQVSIIRSAVDTSSADFKENETQMKQVMDRIKDLKAKAALGGSDKARQKHISRGKMLPREYAFCPRIRLKTDCFAAV